MIVILLMNILIEFKWGIIKNKENMRPKGRHQRYF